MTADPSLVPLDAAALRARLGPGIIGRELEVHAELPSTNDRAWQAARAGAREGLVVLAEHQTQGRGRRGRAWVARPGQALLVSVYLCPRLPVDRASVLTVLGATAVREALAMHTRAPLGLRWPNDVLLAGRKVAGVLVEAHSDLPEGLVLGLGVNVLGRDDEFPPTLRGEATTLAAHTDAPPDRPALAAALLEALERRYQDLLAGRLRELNDEWRRHLVGRGRRVRLRLAEGELRGVLRDVDARAGLTLDLPAGGQRRLALHEVWELRIEEE